MCESKIRNEGKMKPEKHVIPLIPDSTLEGFLAGQDRDKEGTNGTGEELTRKAKVLRQN